MDNITKRFDRCVKELNEIQKDYYKNTGKIFNLIVLDEHQNCTMAGFYSEQDLVIMAFTMLINVYRLSSAVREHPEEFVENIKSAILEAFIEISKDPINVNGIHFQEEDG